MFKRKKKSIRRSETDISEWNRECKISVWPWHCSCWNINGIKCRWIGNVCAGQRFLQAVFLELSRCLSRCCCRRGVSPAQPNEEWRGDEDRASRSSLSSIGKAFPMIRFNRRRGLFSHCWKTHKPAGETTCILAQRQLHCPGWPRRLGDTGACVEVDQDLGLGSPRYQAPPAVFLHSFCTCVL